MPRTRARRGSCNGRQPCVLHFQLVTSNGGNLIEVFETTQTACELNSIVSKHDRRSNDDLRTNYSSRLGPAPDSKVEIENREGFAIHVEVKSPMVTSAGRGLGLDFGSRARIYQPSEFRIPGA